ncbi:MAG TPA: flagellar basal body P-ring protein FlgI [Pirellulales bacterium]|jgi:flagellar P-ring protein precursor FlgI|nr:flagellar basal body P-ring protein FlgI [Pirellulales bacterium]
MKQLTIKAACLTALAVLTLSGATEALGQIRLKSICRVKGQEKNTLQGLGLVVGLKGTGDGKGFVPTIRSLAMTMELLGNQVGKGGAEELRDAANVALVSVSATVPASGARQGDEVDCVVSSVGAAKSLAGGRLFMTPLLGPQVESTRVYAFAEGAVHVEDSNTPTTGRIHGGCRLEEDFINPFTMNGKITLVLDEHHADFEVAQEIAELINSNWYRSENDRFSRRGVGNIRQTAYSSTRNYLAQAANQQFIEVAIPAAYRDEPVLFVSEVLGLTIAEPQTAARVVINERSGSVVIGADVEIGAVAITHKNIVIETAPQGAEQRFVSLDPGETQTAKLKSLVEALNAVKVPTEDIIEIIKGLERNGKLHGQLIVE